MRWSPWACAALVAALSGCLRGDGDDADLAPAPEGCPVDDVAWSQTVHVENQAGGGPTGGTEREAWSLQVLDETGWSAADADCVRAIRVEATWTNGPSGGADLFVGVVVPGTGTEVLGHDRQQYVLDGEHQESVFAPTALQDYSGAALLDGLEVALHTQWASLSDGGLPVQLHVTLVVP